MKVLVVGGGAREHAIAEAVARSPERASVYVVMKNRNPGLARIAKDVHLAAETDVPRVIEAAKGWGIDLAIIGPEAPLAAGVVDALTSAGILCASPTKGAAEAETDKAFLRRLMLEHELPGSVRHRTFGEPHGLAAFIGELGAVAVKPVGLTGGKGVKVSGDQLPTIGDAVRYAAGLLEKGDRVVIEEKLEGEEFTLQAFTDGRTVVPMPCVQDHKRAFEGDTGPNTGGMGSYSDADHRLPFLSEKDVADAARILKGIVDALRAAGREYRGAIYGQFMATRDGPKVIEVNARFGDPEAMNVLSVLETDYVAVALAMAQGTLAERPIRFADRATVCKYVVPQGYGERPAAGLPVRVDEAGVRREGASVYYAAVHEEGGRVTTTTSRAVAVLGSGGSIEEAEATCERGLAHVSGDAIFVRHDIGTRALVARRVAHMREIRG
ncbi:MAG: phosphoribosylamine--glycine ligase [Methanobacteriota archaeon]